MAEVLSRSDVESAIKDLPGWRVSESAIVKEMEFEGFSQAFAFLTRLAMAAEKANHHPDFSCSYSKVRVELSSHDAGGVTRRDLDLAGEIEKLLGAPASPKPT